MPLDCGSTSVSAICTAIAASTALPPASRISAPASVACGFAAAAIHVAPDHPGLSVQPLAASGGPCVDVRMGAPAQARVVRSPHAASHPIARVMSEGYEFRISNAKCSRMRLMWRAHSRGWPAVCKCRWP